MLKQLLLILGTTLICLMSIHCVNNIDEEKEDNSYYLKQTNDADPAKRQIAIEKLKLSFPNNPDELRAINDTLYDSNVDVRLTSMHKISELIVNGYLDNPDIIISALLDKLNDNDERIRAKALYIIARIDKYYPATMPYLIEALDDNSILVKIEAVNAIYHISSVIESEKLARAQVNAYMREAMNKLIELMDLGDYELLECVISAIVSIGDIPNSSAKKFTMMLKDVRLRYLALLAIQDIGVDDEVIEGVIKVLNDERDKVRREALITLMKFGPEASAAIPSLGEMLESENEEIVYWVIEALSAIGADKNNAGQLLIKELEDAGWEKRAHIVKALIGVYPSNEVKYAVIDALMDEVPEVRMEAAGAIGRIWSGTQEVPVELRYLAENDENEKVKESAWEAINRINEDA